MTTRAEAIRHLWTHKTQNHPWLTDEQLVIDRAEGVWVWTEDGKKLMDGFAGLAVVNVGHGRREIAEAIAEQTVRLAYYPTTRQFSNRPAAELAAKLATLTPGDLDYTLFATSGSEANERAMQIARHYWIARGKPDKHKVISLQGGYHGATMGTFAVCGLPHMTAAYAARQPAGWPTRSARTARRKPSIPTRTRRIPWRARRRWRICRSWRKTVSWRTPRQWASACSTACSRRWAARASSARSAGAACSCARSWWRPTARARRWMPPRWPSSTARRGSAAPSSTRAARSCGWRRRSASPPRRSTGWSTSSRPA